MTTVEPRRACRSLDEREDLLRRCGCRDCPSARRPAGSADRSTARGQSRRAAVRRPRAPPAGASGAAPSCTSVEQLRARGRATLARGQPRRCSGRPTFSRQDSVGSRLKNWKMKPILSRRTRVSSSSERPASGCAVDADLAGGWAVEAADQVEQRRLARARRTDDRHHLAPGDGQADVVERGDVPLAVELLGDAVELDHGTRDPSPIM